MSVDLSHMRENRPVLRPRLRLMLQAMLHCTAARRAKGLALEPNTGELAADAGLPANACLDACMALQERGMVVRRSDASFRLTERGLVELARIRDERAAR